MTVERVTEPQGPSICQFNRGLFPNITGESFNRLSCGKWLRLQNHVRCIDLDRLHFRIKLLDASQVPHRDDVILSSLYVEDGDPTQLEFSGDIDPDDFFQSCCQHN